MSPGEPPTAAEAIAVGRRLVAAVEAAMMATDPVREPFALVLLADEREQAIRLLAQTERRARALRQPGTRLAARWQQTISARALEA